MGFEPTAPGTTNRCSNQLSYNHRKIGSQIKRSYLVYSTLFTLIF